jgi:uncharacterized protein (TIGR03083 family)
MQLQPAYDGPPVITVDGFDDVTVPLLRQRRRLAATLASLTDEQWATQSRCDEWTVQGVVTHLISTDQFWALSVGAGLRGEPTKFLATFDPVASPADLVRGQSALSPADVLAKYGAAMESFAAVLATVAADQWRSVVAEAPPGHLELNGVLMHALWDGWVHERDIAIPLGRPLSEEPDELEAILRYAVGLSPALSASLGSTRQGALIVEATDPSLSLLVSATPRVHVGDGSSDTGPRLKGRAVDLIEGLSHRTELRHDLADDDRWLLHGLAEIFDQA